MTPAAAGAQTIINGSFEQGVRTGSYKTLASGDSTSIFGWTVGGAGIDYIGSYWQASDGNRSLALSARDEGSISQQLTGLTPGQFYRISFDLAGNPIRGPETKTLITLATLGGQEQVDYFSTIGATRKDMNWKTLTYGFRATTDNALLTFSSGTPGAHSPALDNVSMAAVPEPAAWAMMIMGIGFVGGSLRQRRRSALATA